MPSIHSRRVLATAAGLLTLVGWAAAACTRGGTPGPPPASTLPPATVTTTAAPTAGTPDPPPPPASGTVDCGILSGARGYPTTAVPRLDEGPGRCFVDAWVMGRPARLLTYRLAVVPGAPATAGTHVFAVRYLITGPGRVEVTTELSQGALRQECTRLTHDGAHLDVTGCAPLRPGPPSFEGAECGTLDGAPGPTDTAAACLLAAWAAGRPARLVFREGADDDRGGHLTITTYDVLGAGRLRVTTDSRRTVPSEPITVELCTALDHDAQRLRPGGCTPA